MHADTLVDLLLELNIVNAGDVDKEINILAARLVDPRAKKWFRRVPRFFLINIDRLLKEPYVAKAELRPPWASKYYADPRGGWVKGREPEGQPTSPLRVREANEGYDPKDQTYTTALHEPVVQRDIEQNFQPFKPAKAKAKGLFGGQPTKKELQPWMTAPEAKEKEFHHFDPIQTRRRELFTRMVGLVHYLNYQTGMLRNRASEDPAAKANATEAENLLRKLETMKTDDIAGFRDVLKSASDFSTNVKEKPWMFIDDGKVIATSGNLTLRQAVLPITVMMLSKRATGSPNPVIPKWCTKDESYANQYTNQGPLYFVDKGERPYVLAHFHSGQVRALQNAAISAAIATEIAPLFNDPHRFPHGLLEQGDDNLAAAVDQLHQRRPRR